MGKPCVFIRLTGCHLRCHYCDTVHAFHGGKQYSIDQILEEVCSHGISLVEVTGGEPLLQKETLVLLKALCERGFTVLLETSGSLSLKNVHSEVFVIMDIKCPSSGESGQFLIENLSYLKPGDEIKFVLSDKSDFDWSVALLKESQINSPILFSPVHNILDPKILAKWILEAKDLFHQDIRMQIQLHKYIWGDDSQGV